MENTTKPVPFYRNVTCTKVMGGKKPLWNAQTMLAVGPRRDIIGAGNTADNAIRDLQRQLGRLGRVHS